MKKDCACCCESDIILLSLNTGDKVLAFIYVNEEKRRVRAVAIDCQYLGIESMDNDRIFRSIHGLDIADGSLLSKKLMMQDSYVGTAVCAPEDEFSYEIGADIALSKLKTKLENAIMSRHKMLADELRAIADRLEMGNL